MTTHCKCNGNLIPSGNDFYLAIALKSRSLVDGEVVETPFDFDAADTYDARIYSILDGKTLSTMVGLKDDSTDTVIVDAKGVPLIRAIGVEVTGEVDGRAFRAAEKGFLSIVEFNGEARVVFAPVTGGQEANLVMTLTFLPSAAVVGKNAYEIWKEEPGNQDKTLADFINYLGRGESAYEIAVRYGYTGTEAEYNMLYFDAVDVANTAGQNAQQAADTANEMAAQAQDAAELADAATTNANNAATAAAATVDAAIDNMEDTLNAAIAAQDAEIANKEAEIAAEFATQTALINQKQLEIGAVPSDLTPTAGSTNWVTSGGIKSALTANNITYNNSQSGLAAENVQGALDEVSHTIMHENEIFSTIPVAKIINGSNTWVVQSGMQGEFVPVVHGKKYRIVVDSSNSGVIAFMTRATTTNVYYAGGATSRTVLPPSTNVVLTAPSDANYLYFTQIGSTPATVRVYEIETIQDEIDNINDDINTIENAVGLKNSVINFVDFNYIINPNQLLQQTSSSWRMSTSMYKVGDDFTIIPTDQTQQYYPVGFDENFHLIRSYADDGIATGTRTFNASFFGVKYIYVAASNRNSMSIDAQAIFKRESIVCAASDTSCKDGADIICPSTDARESLQLAISYGLLTDRKVILMNGRYILNSYFTEGGGNACLIASGFTTSTGETDDQYGNRIRFTTIEGSNDVLGWADGAILKVSDTLYESVTDATPLTVIRGMVTDWQPWEKASAISLKNIKVILPSNQKAITCVDFGYTDNARVEHLYCSAFDPLVTPLNVHPDDLDIPIANSECVGVKLTFGSNMDAAIYEHISVLGFYAGIDFSGDHAIVNSPTAIYCYYGFTFGKYMHSGGMTLPITIINMTEEHNVCLPIYYAGSSNTKVIQILSGNVYWPEKGCQGNIPFDDPRRVAATIPNHNYRGYINYVNGINPSTGWFDTIQSSLPTSYFAAGSEIYMEQKNMAAPPSATSSVRRTWAKGLGMQCFDTTLNKVVFCVVKNNALAWVDANGTMVDS